jgi:tetratricopeptide (TPR) repeat protein
MPMPPPPAKASPARRDPLTEAVRLHQRGRLAKAAALYKEVLRRRPDHADALHLLGLVVHQQGDHARAEPLIRRALAADSRPAAFHNSLGAVLLALKRPADAHAALEAALERNPVYAEALNNLGIALVDLGRPSEAVASFRRAVDVRPTYVEALINLGRTAASLGRNAAAVGRFEEALALRPDHAKARRYLGDALGSLGRRGEAEAAYRQAIADDGRDAENHAALASLLERTNRLDEGLERAEAALTRDAANLRAVAAAARCERRLGRCDAALRRLDAFDAHGAGDDARSHLLFEKGALLDRLGDYDRAYDAYAEANALALENPVARQIDRDLYPARIQRLRERFTPEWVAGWRADPDPDGPQPCFLVGFPRSGTTLLDQCLDAHPRLQTMEEKDCVDVVRHKLDAKPGDYPDALAGLSGERLADLRATYDREVARHLGGAPAGVLVDKMPLNAIDAGLIHRLFPRAPFILALRHPCDVVLSAFMQAFQPNAAMIHFASLESTARFYAAVMDLWLHYRAVLPLDVVTVRYEDLTQDLAGEMRRLLTGIGLPWDDAVLGYAEHAAGRAIATPSYHQVVQPIYRRSVDRWWNYRRPFEPILPILSPYIEAFGYET